MGSFWQGMWIAGKKLEQTLPIGVKGWMHNQMQCEVLFYIKEAINHVLKSISHIWELMCILGRGYLQAACYIVDSSTES